VEIVAAYRYDIVAAVAGWVEDGFVLAHETHCDRGGEPAERARIGADVEEVP
jgi:hypothetical protein